MGVFDFMEDTSRKFDEKEDLYLEYIRPLVRFLTQDSEEHFEIRARVARTLIEHKDYDEICLYEAEECVVNGWASDEDHQYIAFYPKEIEFIEMLLALIENN